MQAIKTKFLFKVLCPDVYLDTWGVVALAEGQYAILSADG